MKPHPHYTKASITEAIIDLVVGFHSDVDLSAFKGIQSNIEADYPIVEPMILAEGQFQTSPEVTATAHQSTVGYFFSSQDHKKILQSHQKGFTFRQLAPYETWEVLRDEARSLWNAYNAVTQPNTIQQVSIRYINQLDLPLDPSGSLDFQDYLRTVPEISTALPNQDLSGYFMQLQFPQRDLDAQLILNEAVLPRVIPNVVSVLLDLYLFSEVDFSPGTEEVWDLLGKFRDRKNEVFEACITDKTRELLK
jgi:uncharacterized protein (TIGR04255 family)